VACRFQNFLLTLMTSRGVPMLLGGDEFGRTQDGNNNAYCQDNETGEEPLLEDSEKYSLSARSCAIIVLR